MLKTLLIKFVLIVFGTCLLIFIELKLEVIDYLRFVNSAQTLKVNSSSDLIAYSPNGKLFAIAGGKRIRSKIGVNSSTQGYSQVEVRQVSDSSIIKSWDLFAAQNLAFSPNNSMIAAGSRGGKVSVWRIDDGELIYSFGGVDEYFSTKLLAFTPDKNNLVGLTFARNSLSNIFIWDLAVRTNRILSGEFVSAALSPNGETLAIGNRNQTVDFYRLNDLTLIDQLKTSDKPFSLKFSPDGEKVAFIGYSLDRNKKSRSIYFYSVEDGSLLKIFYARTGLLEDEESLKDFAISPDGRYLAASYSRSVPSSFFVGAPRGSDARFYGRIRVWRIEDGKQLSTFRGHQPKTYGITFSPDGKFLASTGGDGKVRFWKMPPRNSSKFWLFCTAGLAVLLYWRRTELIGLINR